jgi:ankyrin repeat protein
VGYSASKDCWICIDANLPVQEFKNDNEIANAVLSSFSKNEITTFSTQIYCTKVQEEDARKWFRACTQQDEWKQLHEIKDKIHLRDSDKVSWLSIASEVGHLELIKNLIDAKADPNSAAEDGVVPLNVAAQNGNLEVVKALIAAKADPNLAAEDGVTPLYKAAQDGYLEVVKAFITAKADPNLAADDGVTPLYMAAQEGYLEVVKALIAAKADPNRVDEDGETPLDKAMQKGHLEVVKIIAVSLGYSDILGRLLLNESASIKAINKQHKAAIVKVQSLLVVERDEKLTSIVQDEFKCFMDLQQLIKSLSNLKINRHKLSLLCSIAYSNYSKTNTLDERRNVYDMLKMKAENLNKEAKNERPFFGRKNPRFLDLPKKTKFDSYVQKYKKKSS